MATDLTAAVESARAYEGLHVPALFRQWAGPVLDAAGVGDGHDVLDVACGTGVLARESVARVGATGSVVGADIAPGMLAVAAELEPRVDWHECDAGALPFGDGEFDAVVSQFGLMFFPDRVAAIREMLRCARSGAPVVVAVWDRLERSEPYPTSVELFTRMAGPAAGDALRAPFVLGDTGALRGIFEDAGAATVEVDTRVGTAHFPSVRTMVEADLRGWLPVMGVDLDDDLIEEILAEAEELLADHVVDDGTMVFDAPAHIVVARA